MSPESLAQLLEVVASVSAAAADIIATDTQHRGVGMNASSASAMTASVRRKRAAGLPASVIARDFRAGAEERRGVVSPAPPPPVHPGSVFCHVTCAVNAMAPNTSACVRGGGTGGELG